MDALRLVDYSDRELLLMMLDHADVEGWVSSEDLANALGVQHKHPRQCVGSRLSWMRRYGAVERHEVYDRHTWRVTPVGEVLARGRLSEAEQRRLDRLGDEKMLLATRALAERQRRDDNVLGTLMRREWRYSTRVG